MSTFETTEEPISGVLTKTLNDFVSKPHNREKVIIELEKFSNPENLPALGVKECNEVIWYEMLQPRTRSENITRPFFKSNWSTLQYC